MEIYIPPSRAHKASSISLGLTPDLPDDVGVLEDAAKEIENAIFHLKRSNKEIQDFDPNGDDPELVDAIAGNIMALAKKEERLQLIREKMAALGARSDPCVHDTTPANSKPAPHAAPASSSAGTVEVDGLRGAAATTGAPGAAATDSSSCESMGSSRLVGLTERIQTLDISSTPTEDLDEGGIDL